MMSETNIAHMLAELTKHAKKQPTHSWDKYADAIHDVGGIVDASRTGFRIHVDDGLLEVEFPGGLTAEHYSYFASLLKPWDQAELAEAVLRNLTRHSYLELDDALRLLGKQYGSPAEEWLPERVADVGFVALSQEIEAAVVACRRISAMQRGAKKLSLDVETGKLTCGTNVWRFQKRAHGSTWLALSAFAAAGFPPHVKLDLRADKVRNACNYLNEKTRPVLNWSATEDSILFCDIITAD